MIDTATTATQLRAHANALRAQADRYDQAADLLDDGDDAGGLLAAPKPRKAKPTKPAEKKNDAERPRHAGAGRPESAGARHAEGGEDGRRSGEGPRGDGVRRLPLAQGGPVKSFVAVEVVPDLQHSGWMQ